MSASTATLTAPAAIRSPQPTLSDYALIGGAGERAQAAGLVNADWYRCEVPRALMKELMKRSDGPAIRDTLLWFGVIAAAGVAMALSWGTAWFALAFFVYATLYCGPADSRWHESSHGTPFKTRWMSDALYQVASFMVLRRPTRWRWSHARHHTDTLVTGRDPEIAVPVPTDLASTVLNLFQLRSGPRELARVVANAFGQLDAEEKTFVPEMEWPKMVREARAWLLVYAVVVLAAVLLQSWLPLFFIGLPSFAGAWLFNFFGFTQHAGLPENVTDHRRNCRTVHMNPVFRFLYWNMNYHVEHHMFPMVPYHALPRLHAAIQADCPPAYTGTWQAYREIIPAVLRQRREPGHFVQRPIPAPAVRA
ncbi:fatty acid desaturase family protein [Leptothrix discophora]|uniref:Fatty acid desaturase family protein n=1 Tax=Leptothrix discophora TaxID=89 RepID=A0ABT9G3E2_LEPDI|nr:fatty acid desaturase family protein [Leptothrix discophora]MDP4301012.1 fatty acid desaturase family protein [Leptothrix discophora]